MKQILSFALILLLVAGTFLLPAQADAMVDVSFRDMEDTVDINASRAGFAVSKTMFTEGSASLAFTLKDDCADQLFFFIYRKGLTGNAVNIAGATYLEFDLYVPADGYFDTISGDAGVNIDTAENLSKWGSSAGKVSASTVKAGLKNLKAGWNSVSFKLDAPATATNAVDFRFYLLKSGAKAGDVLYIDDVRFVNDETHNVVSPRRNAAKQVIGLIAEGRYVEAKNLYEKCTPSQRDYIPDDLLQKASITPIAPPKQYTLTFNTNGGSEIPAQQVYQGDVPMPVADPVKDGKTFLGWYLGDTKKDLATFEMPRKDITLTARFEGDTFDVTVDTDGGLPYSQNQTLAADQTIAAPVTPVKAGYIFTGWYVDGKKIDLTAFTMPWEGVTLTAGWKEGEDTRGFGNVNGDTKIDAKDALDLLKVSVQKITFTDDQVMLGDVNKDDAIDAKDALDVLKYSVGKLSEFSCVAWYAAEKPVDPQPDDPNEKPDDPEPPAPTPVDIEMNIMTFNIRQSGANNELDGDNGWLKRKEKVMEYLNSSGADVLFLQEVRKSQSEDITALLGSQYKGVYKGRENIANPEGLMTLYNAEKFELVGNELFWLSETPDVASKGWGANYYRICLVVTLKDKETGKQINLFNVHLDHQVEFARVNGLKLVMERVNAKEGHSIVAGDFNTTSASGCYDIIADVMTDTSTTPGAKVFSTCQEFGAGAGNQNGSPIDFIFVDKEDTTLKSYRICNDTFTDANGTTRNYSDHYAVTSKVLFTYFN